jgi:sugar lactone lactonase YvrE
MSHVSRVGLIFGFAVAGIGATAVQIEAQNSEPNPYRTVPGVWAPLPDGRDWGSTSLVEVSPDGETIWAVDRCGENNCVGHDDLDVVFQFDKRGRILTQFGAGLFEWPHGIDVDANGNVWVVDARGNEERGRGHQVIKFSPEGVVLLRLGTAGVAGRTRTTLDQPNDVLVAPNGDIFVADGHPGNGNNRIVKYSSDGRYLMEWGETGSNPGEFRTPHALAMDDNGLLYVGDRSNRRIQVFEQDGTFVRDFYNMGRASGITIRNNKLYVADSESSFARNPGFRRGIRVMDLDTGYVIAFIPDPEPSPGTSGTSAAEGVAVDNEGNVYGAEVGPRALRKHLSR